MNAEKFKSIIRDSLASLTNDEKIEIRNYAENQHINFQTEREIQHEYVAYSEKNEHFDNNNSYTEYDFSVSNFFFSHGSNLEKASPEFRSEDIHVLSFKNEFDDEDNNIYDKQNRNEFQMIASFKEMKVLSRPNSISKLSNSAA